jgi:hypothetical protein
MSAESFSEEIREYRFDPEAIADQVTLDSLSVVVSQLGGRGPSLKNGEGYLMTLPNNLSRKTILSFNHSFSEIMVYNNDHIEDEVFDPVIEHLQKVAEELPLLESVVLKTAHNLGEFSAEELRDSINGLTFDNKSDEQSFDDILPDALQTICNALEDSGYIAEWSYNNEKSNYSFFTTNELKPLARTMEVEQPQPIPTEAKNAREQLFLSRVAAIDRIIGKDRRTIALTLLASEFSIRQSANGTEMSIRDALEIISDICAQDIYHTVLDEDGKLIVRGPRPDKRIKARKTRGASSSEKSKKPKTWGLEDDVVLGVLLKALGNMSGQHLEQGVDINKVFAANKTIKELGIGAEKARQIARRADAAKILEVASVNRTAGKGLSQRRSLLIARVTKEKRIELRDNIYP